MTHQRIVPALLASTLLGAALTLSGCWVTTDQGQAMEADIVKLKADNVDARRTVDQTAADAKRDHEELRAALTAETAKVEAKIQEVNTALDGLRHTASKTGADLADQQADDEKEIARLRGLVEEVQAQNTALQQQLTQSGAGSLPDRVAALEKKLAADEAKIATYEQQAAAQQQLANLPADKDDFYKLAHKKLDEGDFDGARTLFTEFISRWKKDAMAGSAQYWIGYSYFQQKNYRKAGLEFQKVCDNFPKSEKAPEAEFMVGECFTKLDMKKDALSFFQTVVDAYPRSAAAKKAKERIAELGHHR